MKAAPLAEVFVDLVMAIQAEIALFGIAEHGVAFPAFPFILGMPLDHRSGHDELFEDLRLPAAQGDHRSDKGQQGQA